jgi:hypothetical protein
MPIKALFLTPESDKTIETVPGFDAPRRPDSLFAAELEKLVEQLINREATASSEKRQL